MSALGQTSRIVKIGAGFGLLVIGVFMLVLPGPGLVAIGLGLAILAGEFAWARQLLIRVKSGAADVARRVLK